MAGKTSGGKSKDLRVEGRPKGSEYLHRKIEKTCRGFHQDQNFGLTQKGGEDLHEASKKNEKKGGLGGRASGQRGQYQERNALIKEVDIH